jgi:hypothetical protein
VVKDNFHKARIIRDLKKEWAGKGAPPKSRKKAALEAK